MSTVTISADSLLGRFMAELQTGEKWQDRAVCAQTDPEAFFPERGGSTREAKTVCMGCPVRKACLQYALDNDERFGVWGGTSERERRRIREKKTTDEAIPVAGTSEEVRAA